MSPIKIENDSFTRLNKIKTDKSRKNNNNNNIDMDNITNESENDRNVDSNDADSNKKKISMETDGEVEFENKNNETDLNLLSNKKNNNINMQNINKRNNNFNQRNFNGNYNNYNNHNYHNSNNTINNMDSVILLKIDNLPPGKNWKQIKYLIGGIIHHSNILKVKLLPIMTSIIPPFVNFQSCIVTLKGNLRWEMINELIITINSYKWDYFDLYAYLLPNFGNTNNTNNYNNSNNPFYNSSNNNFSSSINNTNINFSNSSSTTTSIPSPTILPSLPVQTNVNPKNVITENNDSNIQNITDKTNPDTSDSNKHDKFGTTSTPVRSFDMNSTNNSSSNNSSPGQNLNSYRPIMPAFPMPSLPPNYNQPFIPPQHQPQQQNFGKPFTQIKIKSNTETAKNDKENAYESGDESEYETGSEGANIKTETVDETHINGNGVTNKKSTTHGLTSPSISPISDSDPSSLPFPNSPPINPYLMYPTMSSSPNTANAMMANMNNNFGTGNNGYPFFMYPNNPMLPFPMPHENMMMPMQPGLPPNFNNTNAATPATGNNNNFNSNSNVYNTNYGSNNFKGNIHNDANNYSSNYSYRKRYSYHQPKFDDNNNNNNNGNNFNSENISISKDSSNKFKNYNMNSTFDPNFFVPTNANNTNSTAANYSSRSNSISNGPLSLPAENFIPGSLPIPPIPMPISNLNQNGNIKLQQQQQQQHQTNSNMQNSALNNPSSSTLNSNLPPPGNVLMVKRNTNPFKQPKKLKNIFNERNFRRQMTERGMWQLKLSNFPPYLLPETQKLLQQKPLHIDLMTNSFDKYGKLRWTVLKDFIKLKCPKLLDLEELSHIDSNGKTININNNTREFYVGVYENQDIELNINLKDNTTNNGTNEGSFYQMEAIYYNAIIGFHNKELKETCLEKLKNQEYSLGYKLKVTELPPYNDDDFELNKLNDLNLN